MALNAPCLPPNPLRPRAFGGLGAEGMKKEIPSNSARTKTLARQPSEKVRAFLIKYQDRVLYGLDAGWQPYFLALPPGDKRRNAHLQRLETSYREDYA